VLKEELDMKNRYAKPASASAAVVLACGLALTAAKADGGDTIKIGVPTAQTGPLGVDFTQVKRAVEFAVDEANSKGGVNGRKVEVRYADTESKPDVARRQAEKLALQGFNLLTGTISSSEGLAMGPGLERWNALYVSSFSKSAKLTGDSCQTRLFRVNQADASDALALKGWLKLQKPKKWVMMGVDSAWGHDLSKSFDKAAADSGMSVVTNLFAPAGTTDFAPYIHQAKDAGADGLYAGYAAQDAINFLQQSGQFGLFDNMLVAGNSINYDATIQAAGSILKGVWGGIDYSPTIDTPENKSFVASWKQKYNGDDPSDQEGQAYMGIHVLLEGVEKAGSADPAAVAKALSGGTFDTLFGKATIRAGDHQMVLPNYFGQVTLIDGKLKNVVKFNLSPEEATPPLNTDCKLARS
jgi:branched-chain amino acid transport system substrate-binding protein